MRGAAATTEDLARARAALHAIPPDLPRDEWVRAGMAAHAAGLPFDEFDAWSAGGGNYDARAARDTWRSFKDGKGLGPGTLFKMAAQAGWSPRDKRERASHAKALGRTVEAPKRPRAGMGVAQVWGRLPPAPATHGYIVAKDGRPDGLRVVPEGDPLRVNGERMAGCLVVPVVPLSGGEPVSLQFIAPPELKAQWRARGKNDKQNLPNHEMAGVFIVGDLLAGGAANLCEGIGTAWACWKATGVASVVCFGWGNVGKVARELRQRDPSVRLVLVPDAGKEAEAEAIARELAAQFVTMPEGWPANADVNDLAQRDGFDALEALLLAPEVPAQRFRLLGSADLRALPPLAWCVRGVLPAHGLASVYGPSGSGKSFLVLDAAAAIAEGAEWFGYRVTQTPVVYCALEGEAGFRVRVAAWEAAKGRSLPAGLRLVLQAFKLTDPQDVTDLAAAVLTAGAGAVVILDTLNRAAPEADENSSADMGRILEAAKALQRLTGGLALVVHHPGKDATRGLRGHSSLFAALDAAVEVTREGDRREWKVAKAKDGQDGAVHPFRLSVVDLGEDDQGESVTSCVIAPDESPQDVTRSRLPKGGNQKVVLDALGELLRKSATFGRAGAPPVRPCVQLEPAVEAIAPRLTCEPKRQKERVRQALTGLTASGVVTCRDGWLWLP
ncbi:MAG: AAA family ATPase [Rubrivivax sp.]|nr:AAA family ATPase [Rubrivivax sp.]